MACCIHVVQYAELTIYVVVSVTCHVQLVFGSKLYQMLEMSNL